MFVSSLSILTDCQNRLAILRQSGATDICWPRNSSDGGVDLSMNTRELAAMPEFCRHHSGQDSDNVITVSMLQ